MVPIQILCSYFKLRNMSEENSFRLEGGRSNQLGLTIELT